MGFVTTFNLRRLKLRSGEQFADERELKLEPLQLGGQRYLPVPEEVDAQLTISRATTGWVFGLNFPARLHGWQIYAARFPDHYRAYVQQLLRGMQADQGDVTRQCK